MKQYAVFISINVFLVTTLAAQEEMQFNKILFKMSPQHLTRNVLKVGAEIMNKSRTKSYSILLNVSANNRSQDSYGYEIYPYSGAGLELQMRKYLNPLNLQKTKRGREYYQSAYFSGLIQGGTYDAKFNYSTSGYNPITGAYNPTYVNYSVSVQNVALGFTIGIQRTLWKVLTVDGFIGAAYQISAKTISGQQPTGWHYESNGIYTPDYYGVLPKVGLLIGVAL